MSKNYFDIYMNGEILCSSEDNEGILSPEINKEINNAGTMSFTILPSHPRWAEVKRYLCYIDVEIYGKNVFRGRVTSVSQDFYGQKKVECEGALSFLNDSFISDTTDSDSYDINVGLIIEPKNWLIRHNRQVESWKQFTIYNMELYGGPNLIDPKKLIDGRWDPITNSVVPLSEFTGEKIYDDLIPVDISQNWQTDNGNLYWLSIDKYDGYTNDNNTYWLRAACYDENKNYLRMTSYSYPRPGIASNTTMKGHLPIYNPLYGTDVKYIRPMGFIGDFHMWFQLSEKLEFTNGDSESTGGYEITMDRFSNYVLDQKNYMIRSRVEDDLNVLDLLNPYRNYTSGEIEFGVNLSNLNFENVDCDPYSVIYPLIDGKSPGIPDPYTMAPWHYDIQRAIDIYGRIGRTFEIGKDVGTDDVTEMEKRCKQIAELYDPLIPDSFTVTAFDQSIYLGNEVESMIDVGDPVHVYSEPHGIDTTMLCLSMRLNLYDPSNNEYKIGKYIPDGEDYKIEALTKSFADSKKKKK